MGRTGYNGARRTQGSRLAHGAQGRVHRDGHRDGHGTATGGDREVRDEIMGKQREEEQMMRMRKGVDG